MAAHSILVVASFEDAQRISAMGALDQAEYPHFHCGSLDAGIFGQVFWEVSDDKRRFSQEVGTIEVVHSGANEVGTVVVYALPQQVAQRYARLSDEDINRLATRWSQPNGRIRMRRSEDFYQGLMLEIARLARIAVQGNRLLLVRTQCRGPHNKRLQPIAREDARSG